MVAKRQTFPGLGARLRMAMKRAGYWKNEKPDVAALDAGHKFLKQSVYDWLAENSSPSYVNLMRIAAALRVSPGWLLLGDQADVVPSIPVESPPHGGSVTPPNPPVREVEGRGLERRRRKRKRA